MLKTLCLAGSIMLASMTSHAQVNPSAAAIERQQNIEAITRQLAPIDTREDLVRYLNNNDPRNPLMKLSAAARQRLLDTVTVNDEGQISSYWIDDIRSELSPSEAYRVLALFGHPQNASKLNNGRIDTETAKKSLSLKAASIPSKRFTTLTAMLATAHVINI